MRKLNTKNKYNYVFNLFTSFGYFENKKDNILVVQGISKALKKNGILLRDCKSFINLGENDLVMFHSMLIHKSNINLNSKKKVRFAGIVRLRQIK